MRCEFCGESFKDYEALSKHLHEKHRDREKLAIFEHPINPEAKEKVKTKRK